MNEAINLGLIIWGVGMGIVNLVIGYLVIPTRSDIVNLAKEFNECRTRGEKMSGITGEKFQGIAKNIDKQEATADEYRKCLQEVKEELIQISFTSKVNAAAISQIQLDIKSLPDTIIKKINGNGK